MIRPLRHFAKPAAVVLLATGVLSSVATVALAQYVPPDRGLPGRREGGGTRGECILSQPTLTALIPSQNFGTTVKEYPSFFWYVPQTSATTAEFVLMDGNRIVYEKTIDLPRSPGILQVSLPQDGSVPPLTVGKDYQWYFSIICNADDRSGDLLTRGWVQRQALSPALATKLTQTPLAEHATVYAQAGIWYDAVEALADLRQQPVTPMGVRQSQLLSDRWNRLLGSVGLEGFANQPFIVSRNP
ncbi:DUF928 domain-containing protein [Leptolyngbya ohadii]|uniref:DUF928 domain-containing protein n=1 Tax=Leptolyngbya ohadii TaxID=1962290 RepID=UPI000B5A19CB|nr:DUF928 domain-containing protein [Leptolyngbya ohadii]